ncbi:uncharacterized protein B0H18DRAFT_954479 [Fomitopsis serialis]|uniref:uncharacterized protein n=1 Tax=Fomitopsis serialis TaxID=139415 RepID=UPI002008489B|nr:uncharacterized protein B0H18DRAFT_954479 [Neoantrodia serialis]KAH9927364.1 hypothetical protein B0H18DRAFT_954479 [Neoantrodia serialis]
MTHSRMMMARNRSPGAAVMTSNQRFSNRDDHGLAGDDEAQASIRPPRFRSKNAGSRSSSVTSSLPIDPPTTDTDDAETQHSMADNESEDDSPQAVPRHRSESSEPDLNDGSRYAVQNRQGLSDDGSDMEMAEVVVRSKPRPLTKNQRKKLKDEMPEIREAKIKAPHASQVDEDNTVVWQSHTEIVLKHGGVKSMKIDLKPQNADVRQLIHESYPIGDQLLVFGHEDQPLKFSELKIMETPMQKECVDKIAFKALVKAADKLRFDGEGVSPPASQPNINEESPYAGGGPNEAALLTDMRYIYPWTEEAGFDQNAPYENPVIIPAVHAAFFMSTPNYGISLLSNGDNFKSSNVLTASEYEIPPRMLALTMTAVEAVVSDHKLKLQKPMEFGPANASTYREHMIRLADFRQQKPNRYHRVMHNIFKAVVCDRFIFLWMHFTDS